MTLKINHSKVSGKAAGNNPNRIYGTHWDADHAITGTADASQLNANVVQSVTNDTNIQGTISGQNLTFSWAGQAAATRGGTGIGTYTLGDTLYSSAANTLAKLAGNTTSTKKFLTQTGTGTVSAAPAWGSIVASDVGSGTALTKTDDTNVTLTLGGSPSSALLAATSVTVGWTGTLAASRGGFGTDVSASSGVPLFSTGVPTFTSTTGSGNFVRATSATLVTPALGTPSSGTLTNCTGLPLSGLSSQASYTLVGNATGSSASPTAFTIDGLTLKASPASGDEVLIWDVAGAAFKKATVSGIGSSSGVSSIAGNTGAFTLANGIDNSTNQIQLTAARRTLPTTQSLTSGTGATYTTPANCLWIEVFMVGGGGGGGGVTNGTPGAVIAGTAGGTTTFNSINAAGGSGASGTTSAANTSVGGAAGGTGGTGTATRRAPGGAGGSGGTYSSALASPPGGSSYFCGNTAPVAGNTGNGTSAPANSGAGGGGAAGGSTNFNVGPGGGGGEFVYLIINSPSATYTYTIGTSGGGGAGSNFTGGAGGTGFIFVIEHYGS